MGKTRYIALLRGINVGGKNIIKMADLKRCFEALGLSQVETYIQSGNVLFNSSAKATPKLIAKIEKALSEAFSYTSSVVLVSAQQLAKIVDEAPAGFGKQPGKYRYDVLFVKPPLKTKTALEQLSTEPGVDSAAAGSHALYFRRLTSRASQSRLNKLAQLPIYRNMTIRNWNTTTKLLAKVTHESAA